ncbi:hypothetical protein V2O64_18080 [Verrucomicrobiaceae bacterium 227]
MGLLRFHQKFQSREVIGIHTFQALARSTFEGCLSREPVIIGRGLMRIQNTTFREGSCLTEFLVWRDDTTFSSREGALFNQEQTEILTYLPKLIHISLALPEI